MKKTDFHFDPALHKYYIDNREAPGTTGIIKDNFGERPWHSDYNAKKGSALHLACHYYVRGILNEATVDERIRGKLNGFKLFLQQTQLNVFRSELKLFSKKYNFAGTLDLLLFNPLTKKLILGDIKSSYDPVALVQLAAYYLLLQEERGFNVSEALVIIVNDRDSYDLKTISKRDLELNKNVFLANLTTTNFKIKHNLYKGD